MSGGGVLSRINTSTLLQIAGGTLLVGSTCIYLAQKSVQRRVRALPHYRQVLIKRIIHSNTSKALEIVAEHEQAKSVLGPPIVIGSVDLADRRRNYVGDLISELRIPVCGQVDSGFMDVRAIRSSTKDDFETAQVELELESNRQCRVVIYDNGLWTKSSS
ncbi:unnamed protein product [Anisakis simplex]|uniref:RING-type E3 ubiquitin transferase n=1 Tax=Anisakis simplex TaxID=6269 RepID=A0A0M3JTU9_ANISI|nr:unnamed protein product [Anisakis simplex]